MKDSGGGGGRTIKYSPLVARHVHRDLSYWRARAKRNVDDHSEYRPAILSEVGVSRQYDQALAEARATLQKFDGFFEAMRAYMTRMDSYMLVHPEFLPPEWRDWLVKQNLLKVAALDQEVADAATPFPITTTATPTSTVLPPLVADIVATKTHALIDGFTAATPEERAKQVLAVFDGLSPDQATQVADAYGARTNTNLIVDVWHKFPTQDIAPRLKIAELIDRGNVFSSYLPPKNATATTPLTMTQPSRIITDQTPLDIVLHPDVLGYPADVGYEIINTDTGKVATDLNGNPIRLYHYWSTVSGVLPPGNYKLIYEINREWNPNNAPHLTYYTYDFAVKTVPDYANMALQDMPPATVTVTTYIANLDTLTHKLTDALKAYLDQAKTINEQLDQIAKLKEAATALANDKSVIEPPLTIKGVEIPDNGSTIMPLHLFLVHKADGVYIYDLTNPKDVRHYKGETYDAALHEFLTNADTLPFGQIAVERPIFANPNAPLATFVPKGETVTTAQSGKSGLWNVGQILLIGSIGVALFIPFVGEGVLLGGLSAETALAIASVGLGISSTLTGTVERAINGNLALDENTAHDIFSIVLQVALPIGFKFGGKFVGKFIVRLLGDGSAILEVPAEVDGVPGATYKFLPSETKEFTNLIQTIYAGGKSEAELDVIYAQIRAITGKALVRSYTTDEALIARLIVQANGDDLSNFFQKGFSPQDLDELLKTVTATDLKTLVPQVSDVGLLKSLLGKVPSRELSALITASGGDTARLNALLDGAAATGNDYTKVAALLKGVGNADGAASLQNTYTYLLRIHSGNAEAAFADLDVVVVAAGRKGLTAEATRTLLDHIPLRNLSDAAQVVRLLDGTNDVAQMLRVLDWAGNNATLIEGLLHTGASPAQLEQLLTKIPADTLPYYLANVSPTELMVITNLAQDATQFRELMQAAGGDILTLQGWVQQAGDVAHFQQYWREFSTLPAAPTHFLDTLGKYMAARQTLAATLRTSTNPRVAQALADINQAIALSEQGRLVGFDGWLSMAANQTDTNIINLAGELIVARQVETTIGQNGFVQIGQDSLSGLPSFDVTVIENGQITRSIEIRSPRNPIRSGGDLKDGVEHAADKLPGPPTGTKEGGVVIQLAPGPGVGRMRTKLLSDLNNVGPFPVYLPEVQQLEVITIYDRNGNILIQFERNPALPPGQQWH